MQIVEISGTFTVQFPATRTSLIALYEVIERNCADAR